MRLSLALHFYLSITSYYLYIMWVCAREKERESTERARLWKEGAGFHNHAHAQTCIPSSWRLRDMSCPSGKSVQVAHESRTVRSKNHGKRQYNSCHTMSANERVCSRSQRHQFMAGLTTSSDGPGKGSAFFCAAISIRNCMKKIALNESLHVSLCS